MSFQQWANNGCLQAHRASPKEIEDQLKIVERDLADAVLWRFRATGRRPGELFWGFEKQR